MTFHLEPNQLKEMLVCDEVIEIAVARNTIVQHNSFEVTTCKEYRFYFIVEGRFTWKIGLAEFCVTPGDLVIVLPEQQIGNEKGILELGKIARIFLSPGNNSIIAENDNSAISTFKIKCLMQILTENGESVIGQANEVGEIFKKIGNEFLSQETFYCNRIQHLVEELLIVLYRLVCRKKQPGATPVFNMKKLNEVLLNNLAFNWTLAEMAAATGHGTTSFAEKVKKATGFSPFNYLIYLRVNEAVKMLQNRKMKITEIALHTGFYSSQHFAGIFKKFTGYTPSEIRNNGALF